MVRRPGPWTLIGHERRWAFVRRLFHGDDLDIATQVVGLLPVYSA